MTATAPSRSGVAPPPPPRFSWSRLVLAIAVLWVMAWSFMGVQGSLVELITGAPRMVDLVQRALPPDMTVLTDPKEYDLPTKVSLAELALPIPLDEDRARDKEYWWRNTFPNTVLGATIQTIQIAVSSTVLALIMAFPLSFLAASNTSPHPALYHATKLLTNFLRTIPDFTVALVLITAIGLGPFAGTLALAFHTTTVLIKLFAESIEAIDSGVVEALQATGARHVQVLSFAVVPQVMPAFVSFVLYRFETNIRAAAVLGMIGAGGIGFLMYTDFRMFQYQKAATTVAVMIVLVMIVDYASARLRRLVT